MSSRVMSRGTERPRASTVRSQARSSGPARAHDRPVEAARDQGAVVASPPPGTGASLNGVTTSWSTHRGPSRSGHAELSAASISLTAAPSTDACAQGPLPGPAPAAKTDRLPRSRCGWRGSYSGSRSTSSPPPRDRRRGRGCDQPAAAVAVLAKGSMRRATCGHVRRRRGASWGSACTMGPAEQTHHDSALELLAAFVCYHRRRDRFQHVEWLGQRQPRRGAVGLRSPRSAPQLPESVIRSSRSRAAVGRRPRRSRSAIIGARSCSALACCCSSAPPAPSRPREQGRHRRRARHTARP